MTASEKRLLKVPGDEPVTIILFGVVEGLISPINELNQWDVIIFL